MSLLPQASAFINLDFIMLGSFDCIAPLSFYTATAVRGAMPLILGIVFYFGYVAISKGRRVMARVMFEPEKSMQRKDADLWCRYVRGMLLAR